MGVLPGRACALRTGCWPDPAGRLEAGGVWTPSIQKAASTRAWLGNLTAGWGASRGGCDPPKAPTPHLNPRDAARGIYPLQTSAVVRAGAALH